MTKPALTTALALAARGYPVFPVYGILERDGKLICACRKDCGRDAGKHPEWALTPNGLKNATTNLEQVRNWGRQRSNANWAWRTDTVVVSDVDLRKNGDDALREIEREHGEMPLTWQSISGSGGPHIIYKKPPGIDVKGGNDRLGPGIDIKSGPGGYIVIPGSRHICGRRYEWSVDHHPAEVELALPPQWMIDQLSEPKRNSGNGAAYPTAKPAANWLRIFHDGLGDGERDNALLSLSGHLLRRNVDAEVTHGIIHAVSLVHCTPPKTDDEIERIVGSACKHERVRREGIKK